MPSISQRDRVAIYHIHRYCQQINDFLERCGRSREVFDNDNLFRNAISMAELQIGELTGHLSEEFKENNADIPWKQIRGMRNLFAHNYGKMNLKVIWDSAVNDTPILEKFCQQQLELYNQTASFSPAEKMNEVYADFVETTLIRNSVHREFLKQYGELPENLDTPENRATVSKYIIAQLDSGELTEGQRDKLKNLKQAIANAEEPLFIEAVDKIMKTADEMSEIHSKAMEDMQHKNDWER